MNLDIKLHHEDLPDQLTLSDNISVDCEFMGLNVDRDKLCLVQISTGKNDAHIIKLNRDTYDAPNLKKSYRITILTRFFIMLGLIYYLLKSILI